SLLIFFAALGQGAGVFTVGRLARITGALQRSERQSKCFSVAYDRATNEVYSQGERWRPKAGERLVAGAQVLGARPRTSVCRITARRGPDGAQSWAAPFDCAASPI